MNIGTSGNIFIERAHPAYEHVIDFLVSCCEPVSRTQHMEQYRIDSFSLSAATAEGTYTLDMIEVILRHYRLNAAQELPVDLERCTALHTLVTALEESTSTDLEDLEGAGSSSTGATVTPSPSSTAPQASLAARVAARVPLPPCLQDVDFTGTALAAFYPGKTTHPERHRCVQLTPSAPTPPSSSVKVEHRDDDTSSTKLVDPRSESSAAPASPSSPRRVLQLFRPSSPSPQTSTTAFAPPLTSASPPTRRAVISLAVVRPDDVAQPLPDAIATMLSEEENASRVQIVLQPRLRRFHQFESGTPASANPLSSAGSRTATPAPHAGSASGGDKKPDEELFYFIESRQRAHLELVLDALKEFLEPVLLYGKPRYIISDVDRSPASAGTANGHNTNSGGSAERVARDGGRPAVLRLLYQPQEAQLPGSKAYSRDSLGMYGSRGSAHTASHGSPLSPAGAVGFSQPARGPAAPTTAPASRFIYKCQVKSGKLKEVKECLFARFNIRADCYYDYMQDKTLHVDNLTLASHVRLRPYQVASLERFRRGSKAHQGVVVLPCGAGKTLTGIGAAAAMQKTTIVMCVNNMSVFQWQREFLRWTDLTESEVTVCTAKVKQMPGRVFITTYNMVIAKRGNSDGAAAEESRAILKAMTSQPWGLLLLDEVHTALAHHFQDVLNTIQYKCVLGLSATLLREDDKIGNLRHLVGPKLYEANWLDLTRAGFLANVECAEVQCPMPLPFLKEYRNVQRARLLLGASRGAVVRRARRQRQKSVFDLDDMHNNTGNGVDEDAEDAGFEDGGRVGAKRRRGRGGAGGSGSTHATNMALNSRALHLASCNPYKLWCTQALLAFHQQRSPPDKVIIFCDYLADVRFFAHHLHLPFMDQRTSEAERTNLLQYFQHSAEVNAIILTRVGDVALDLPSASVIIQVSGLGASRRQEAQRLGRILRPKPPSLDNTCAYFYTLVSQDTSDIHTSYRRQSWLRDQGFAYRILHGDRVLGEFVRVGGQPCCVGAPQWWYQTTQGSENTRIGATAKANATAVFCEGVYWAPFSLDAALKIERAFQLGKDSCALKGSELGAATPRPSPSELGGYALRASESWEVTFSSADAPQTFGAVRIGEGSGNNTNSLRVRRVRRGCLDRTHRCCGGAATSGSGSAVTASDACVQYALSMVLGGHGPVSAASGATLSGDDEDGASSDYDDDVPMDDF